MTPRATKNRRGTTLIRRGHKSTLPQMSVTGHTRGSLPIGIPAPRPCSAPPAVPTLTFLGSLQRTEKHTLLFTAFVI